MHTTNVGHCKKKDVNKTDRKFKTIWETHSLYHKDRKTLMASWQRLRQSLLVLVYLIPIHWFLLLLRLRLDFLKRSWRDGGNCKIQPAIIARGMEMICISSRCSFQLEATSYSEFVFFGLRANNTTCISLFFENDCRPWRGFNHSVGSRRPALVHQGQFFDTRHFVCLAA